MKLEILKYPNEWLTKKIEPNGLGKYPDNPVQLKEGHAPKLMFDSKGIGTKQPNRNKWYVCFPC